MCTPPTKQCAPAPSCRSCSGSLLQLRTPPRVQEHAFGYVQSGCAMFYTCAMQSTLVWVHRAGDRQNRRKRAVCGVLQCMPRLWVGSDFLAARTKLAVEQRSASRPPYDTRTEDVGDLEACTNCCRRPQAASQASRAPTRHLDTDMHTARVKASGVAHGPGRGGLRRDRYIEVAVGQSRGQSRHALTRLRRCTF